MSKFPKYSHEQYSLQCPEWINLPPSPGLTLSINEYRTLQDAAYKRASEIIEEMEKDLAKLRGEVEGIKQLQ